MDTIKNVLLIVVSYIVGRALVDAAFASTVKHCIEAAVQ
jgi:hypothetical protein